MLRWITPHTRVFILIGVLGYAPLLTPGAAASPQNAGVTRPTLASDAAPDGLLSPQSAYDDNLYSAASRSDVRYCNGQGVGTTRYSTTWSGFTGGFGAQQLAVRWSANATIMTWAPNDAANVYAKIEYSLNNGKAWSILEDFTASGAADQTRDIQEKTIALPARQNTHAVQVRAVLQMTLSKCTAANITRAGATLSVYDIRLTPAAPVQGQRPNR
jgi:hypothetical protein